MVLIPEFLMEVFTAMAIGGLIGIEREHTDNKKYAGVRTLSLLGGTAPGAVIISQKTGSSMFVGIYLALAALFSLAIIGVRFKVEGKEVGFTTSTAVFLVAVLGVLVGYNLYSEATSMAIVVALILAQKDTLHGYVDKLKKEEISRALQLGTLSFIMLPLLPSNAVGPLGIIVPQEVLLLAIFVLSIEFGSYILMRQLSSTGVYIAGVLGGTASSFATTGVMIELSKTKEKIFNPLCSATNLATVSMILRNVAIATFILVPATVSVKHLQTIYIPSIAMILPLIISALLLRQDSESIDLQIESPFSLKSGAKFALIFVFVSIASSLTSQVAGSLGVYATAIAGGLVSSTAVATSAATSFTSGSITASTAAGMIMLSIAGSIISKIVLVEISNKEMRKNVSIPMITSIILGLAVFLAI